MLRIRPIVAARGRAHYLSARLHVPGLSANSRRDDAYFETRDRPPSESATREAAGSKRTLFSMETTRLLVVDDMEPLLRMMSRNLSRYLGVDRDQILKADDVASAVAVFQDHGPDIAAVVSDVNMPHEDDGYVLHDRLRGEFSFEGPFVLTSAIHQNGPHLLRILRDNPQTTFIEKLQGQPNTISNWIADQWSKMGYFQKS